MGIIGERFAEAIENKKNDVNSFVWKGAKREVDGKLVQSEVKMMDASPEELQKFYDYCALMLNNTDPKTPGRKVLLSIISDQLERCNCELCLRWFQTEKKKERFTIMIEVQAAMKNVGLNRDSIKTYTLSNMDYCVPEEFSKIPLTLLLDGCLDKLGYFNKQHITLSFILKQGVWFTADDKKNLTIKSEKPGDYRDLIEVAKENLGLRPDIELKKSTKGLNYKQLRAMTTLRSKKYSDLTTPQLETLRNRILFSLADDCEFHIKQWETRMKQIKMVADTRGIVIS